MLPGPGPRHAKPSPPSKNHILHIIRARCAELGFSFGKGIFTSIRYSFPLFNFKNAKKTRLFYENKVSPKSGGFRFFGFHFS